MKRGEELLYTVFRCPAGHKHSIGPDYLVQVGPYPTACTQCGEPWATEEPVFGVRSPADTGA